MKIIPFAFVLSAVSMAFAEQPCKSTVVGDLHIEHFQSKMYGTSMTVRVWLPPGYADASNEKQKYPTLYMLDGQNAFDECTAFHGEHELQIDEAVTKLIGERKIQPMIVVGVDSTHRRDYEYAPYSSPVTDPRAPEPIGKRLPSSSLVNSCHMSPNAIVYLTNLRIRALGELRSGARRRFMSPLTVPTCSG